MQKTNETFLIAAEKIKHALGLALSNKLTDEQVTSLMRTIPTEFFKTEKVLSHAVSDMKKYLVDIDIRQQDCSYEEFYQNKLSNYIFKIDELIVGLKEPND